MAHGVWTPPGRQTFIDPLTGELLANGKVYFYIPTTLLPKNTWADEGLTILNSNPVNLDAGGEATIWGTGLYRQILERPDGTQVWDEVTGLDFAGGTGGGDVIGPGTSVPGHVVIWASTDGTEVADGGVLGALATLNSINNSNWSGTALAVGNGGTGLASTPSNGQLLIGNGVNYSLSTLTAGSGVTITNTPGAISIAFTGGGSGTVTSVDGAGGVTGLTLTGGPITGAGTLTLGGTLAIANGGTGATTASAALTALGGEPYATAYGVNTQTGNYALALSDSGKTVLMNLAGANTLTVTKQATVTWAANTRIDGGSIGAGQTTITPDTGVTLHSYGGALKTAGQYSGFSLLRLASDEWLVLGNLTT